jgi:L,D-peptidoglycan transpeptidase YkuD (ErfK/YbiS/YcfS/YnhG family)
VNKRITAGIIAGIFLAAAIIGGNRGIAAYNDQKQYLLAKTAVDKLFLDKNHRVLAKQVDEKTLKADQAKIYKVNNKNRKTKLEKELKRAKSIFTAEKITVNKVSALMKNGILQVQVTKQQIAEAQRLVTALTDKARQRELQKSVDDALRQLTDLDKANQAVTAIFTDDTHNLLAANVTRDTINKAKQLVEIIRNNSKRNELTNLIEKGNVLLTKAENELAAKAQEKALASTASKQSAAGQTGNTSSSAAPAPIQPNSQAETGFAKIVANSKTAQHTDQILTVVANGSSATVTLWEKSNNFWKEIFSTGGFVGSQGVGQASEGSKRTPRGAYSLGFAFGQVNPGTILPFRQITPNSYWISDVNSSLYNTWQEGSFAGNGNEHLADYANLQYYYAIVINYNTNAVKGAGSAFFLHVSSGRATAGCVSVPKSYMEQFMKRIHPGAYIINVTSQNEVTNY